MARELSELFDIYVLLLGQMWPDMAVVVTSGTGLLSHITITVDVSDTYYLKGHQYRTPRSYLREGTTSVSIQFWYKILTKFVNPM